MKLRISIIALGMSLLLNSGCSTAKTAYNGTEKSYFTNPAKRTAMNNPQGLEAVAEGPVTPDTHAANPGGTGSGAMTGMSIDSQFPAAAAKPADETWGGSLSVR